jgi:hypothetical protein
MAKSSFLTAAFFVITPSEVAMAKSLFVKNYILCHHDLTWGKLVKGV